MIKSNTSRSLLYSSVPILLIILYFLFPLGFHKVANHPLGKVLAILVIIAFSSMDMLHGVFLTLLMILYYEYAKHSPYESCTKSSESFTLSPSGQNYADNIPKASDKDGNYNAVEGISEKNRNDIYLEEAYPEKLSPVKKVNEALFRKKKCSKNNDKVLHKKQCIRQINNIEHVYPSLQYRDGVCNPCDKTCHFTINDKQKKEQELLPKSSKDNVIWDMVTSFFSNEEEPVVIFEKEEVATKF
jgi:hypothetical protein